MTTQAHLRHSNVHFIQSNYSNDFTTYFQVRVS
uniref:Uncharacterized protein n=1 Tax=Anguilla anguilla TaxID=7936 RepID=A0A0E9PN00_ANGAN